MNQNTAATEAVTARRMGDTAAAIGRALDSLGVVPIGINVSRRDVTLHVRGADLDPVADNYFAGAANRYGSNIERCGEFGDIPVEVFASADEYDAAQDRCKACGQHLPAVSE